MAEAIPIISKDSLMTKERKVKMVIVALRNYCLDYATSGLYINMIKNCFEQKGLNSAYQLCKLLDKNRDKPKFTSKPLNPAEVSESDKIYDYILSELEFDRDNRMTIVADDKSIHEIHIKPGWIRPNRYAYDFSLATDKRKK
jgi:hypothetical protein